MQNPAQDAGLIAVLMERFEKQRLPRILAIKEKLDRGGLLDDIDLALLREVLADSIKVKPLIDRHPEYQELAARMVRLYKEITAKAIENDESV